MPSVPSASSSEWRAEALQSARVIVARLPRMLAMFLERKQTVSTNRTKNRRYFGGRNNYTVHLRREEGWQAGSATAQRHALAGV